MAGVLLMCPRTISIMRRTAALVGIPPLREVREMRLVLLTLVAAMLATSCQSSQVDGKGPASKGQPEPTTEVTFEIKNLNWTLTTRKSTATPSKVEVWEYKASGIITTKAPSLQHGGTVVLFEYKATPISMWATQEWTPNFSLLTDGTGEIDLLVMTLTSTKKIPGRRSWNGGLWGTFPYWKQT